MSDQYVCVPREWLNSVALLQMPLDQLQEQAVEFLCEPCDEPAEQHQGEPVAHALAEKVREALDRQACPNAWMVIAYEAVVQNYTHADPGEVERLAILLRQTQVKHSQVVDGLRADSKWLRDELDKALLHLAERDALLDRVVDHANFWHDHPYAEVVEAIAKDYKALSASAEPSAPKSCGACANGCMHGCQLEKDCPPVERDERAAFEKGYHKDALHRDGDEYSRMAVQMAWEGWQARAALERKPS